MAGYVRRKLFRAVIYRVSNISGLENIPLLNIPYNHQAIAFRLMKRIVTIAVALFILSLGTAYPNYIHSARAAAYLDPILASAAASSPSTSAVQVIIVLNHIPSSFDTQTIQAFSTTTVAMTRLPIILSFTNYGNLTNIESYQGVVSLWANRQLANFGNVQTVTHSFGEIPTQHSWWNDVMHVPDVWNLGFQGQGVTVALVDSGIDATNPSLGYSFPNGQSQAPFRVIQNVKVFAVTSFVTGLPLPVDQVFLENQPNTDTTSGHGTSTAGLVAGTGEGSNGLYKGAAPRANVVGLGAGDTEFIFHIVASYDYILSHQQQYHIKIVSNSWGTDFNCSDNLGNPTHDCDPGTPIQLATKAAHDAGMAVFFAAGNSGPGNPTINPFAEPSWVIGVGAGTQEKGLTEFSSRGVPTDPTKQPNLVAPGIDVITTKGQTGGFDNPNTAVADSGNIVTPFQLFYTTFAGTSAATPMAAGVGALILSAASLSPDQLKTTMVQTTDPMLGYLPYQVGTGYVNALSAAKAALGQGFKPSTTRVQAFGDQRFTYTMFLGGAAAQTGVWLGTSTPVFQGAKSITFQASWPTPALPRQWRMEIYAPNDFIVAHCDRLFNPSPPGTLACFRTKGGETGFTFTINNATLISSLNNPGKTSGTWDAILIDFDQGSPGTLTIDVRYPSKAGTHLNSAHDIHDDDSEPGGLPGQEDAVLQLNDGTILSTIPIAPAGATIVYAEVNQPVNTVISVVQIVVVDNNGNIIEVRGAFVMTQADLNARVQQIQQLLLTTTDPTQVASLKTELSAIQATLPTAPLTETLPGLP